ARRLHKPAGELRSQRLLLDGPPRLRRPARLC
ncbi:hypothetical protein AVDCRST_MAG82-1243, partial [uncultured Rubrobacteraceae bacterium]